MGDDSRVRKQLAEAGVRLEENVYVTMRDGVRLAVDIYRPEKEGRYPAVLSMAPYMKEIQQQLPVLTQSIEAGATAMIVPKGYIHIIAQIRGSGLSQGQYDLFDIKQQQDGYDLVEWIAGQPWCTENVGMLGESYFAMIQYLVAAQQPPHLRCITLFGAGTDLYRDFVYQGGVFFGRFISSWGADTIQQCLWPGPVEGKLPPANIFADLFSHKEDGPYYWERSAWTKVDRIKVPVMSIGGNLPSANTATMHLRGQPYLYPRISSPKRFVVTPAGGNGIFLGSKPLNEYILRWLDNWLKGTDTGIMDEPEVAIYDNGVKEWRYENEYPLARTEWTEFYLRTNPDSHGAGEGLISYEPPTAEAPDSYTFLDSRKKVRAGMPVLAYNSSPLENNLKIWGPLSLTLYGSSTGHDTVWFVRLGDTSPDGKFKLLSQGHLRASFRKVEVGKSGPGQPYHSFTKPDLPEPGVIYEYQIEMIPIFYTFKLGHRISLQIASEDFEYHGTSHTTLIYEILPLPAKNTVYHDTIHPSHLLLPVIPDTPAIRPVQRPLSDIIQD